MVSYMFEKEEKPLEEEEPAEEIQIIEEFPSEEWWEEPIEKPVEEEPSEEKPARKKPWWKFW